MLFWILLAVFIVGLVCVAIYENTTVGEWLWNIAVPVAVGGGIGFAASIIILACSYIGLDGYIASNQIRYDSLVYQYENELYDNDNDIGKKELMSEIQDWNENLARCKAVQDDFWVGIYYPDIFDQFEFIELDQQLSSNELHN